MIADNNTGADPDGPLEPVRYVDDPPADNALADDEFDQLTGR
jgi:hypothetical protein